MPANPSISAVLKYGATNIITLSNPTYTSGTGLLTWTGVLGSDVTIPAGESIVMEISTTQAGVNFRINYDSQTKPSKIEFSTSTYINIDDLGIFSTAYPGSGNITQMVSTVSNFIRVAVSDPFGVTDINGVNLAFTDNLLNTTNVSLGSANVVNTSGCVKTYEYAFIPAATALSYTIIATAKEGYENMVTHTAQLTNVPVNGIDAYDDEATGETGIPLIINVLANDLGSLDISSLSIISQPQSGSLQVNTITGQITYLPNGSFTGNDQFLYQICNTALPAACDIAVVTVTILPDYTNSCSEAIVSKTFYMPFPEETTKLRQALINASSGTGWTNVVRNITSITVPYPGTIITYDQWEDGYEADITTPLQSSTKVWGDGILTNGVAPGYPLDIIPPGGGLVLDNMFIYNPRNPANIYFDANDKIYSTGDIAVSKVTGDDAFFAVQAVKADVPDITRYGKSFTVGLGEITGVPYFSYASLFIAAANDGTVVNIDLDGNGTIDATQTINQGQTWFYEGDPVNIATASDVKPGTIITASQPVGVDVLFGGKDRMGTRNINVLPSKFYGNTYYSPVPTVRNDAPAEVYFTNSLSTPITVNWQSGVPASGSVVIPANGYASLTLANSATAAYKFWSVGGESFTAVEVMDADATGSTYDWAITLIASSRLTNYTTTAWAPGSLDGSANYNPIWVTPTANTTIYIKYDGDLTTPTPTMSPCNIPFDIAVSVNQLNYYRIFDPSDNDQSRIAIYTCDNTPFAAVYGEDASVATTASPAMDVGTILTPKCLQFSINAIDDYETTDLNTPIIIGVASNDFGFLCTANPLSIIVTFQPANGTVVVNANGTITYTPNPGYTGNDIFQYSICAVEYPATCDVAQVHIKVTDCDALESENIISGKVFLETLPDDATFTDEGFVAGVRVDLYADVNCNGVIDAGEITTKSTVSDLSGNYEFKTLNGYFARDDFDPTAAFDGNDGSVSWSSNWVEQGDDNNLASGDVRIFLDPAPGSNGNAIRLAGNTNGISRSRTFTNVTAAILNFSFRRQNLNNQGEAVRVQINGTTIYIIDDGDDVGTDNYYNEVSIVIPPANFVANGSNTVQFLTNNIVSSFDYFWLDNVELVYFTDPVCFIAKVNPSNTNGAYSASLLNQQTSTFSTLGLCDKLNYLGVIANLVATNDVSNTATDIPVIINVLANDVVGIPNSTTVTTAGLAIQPANGTVTVNADGTITYIPNAGYIGNDSFQYKVCSLEDPLVCSIALVTVTVSCISIPKQNTLTGMVFLDLNSNGVLNTGEGGKSGVGVNLYLDSNGNGALDTGEPLVMTKTTPLDGNYQFDITPPSVTNTLLDQFNVNTTANQSNGTVSWTANAWNEVNEADGFGAGDITITSANGLRIRNNNEGARRTANLSTAIAATLSFKYTEVGLNLEPGDYVDVEIATTATPASWTLLKRYTGGDGNQTGTDSYDITPYISGTTTIRFISSNTGSMTSSNMVYFDNVQISYLTPTAAKYIIQLAQPIPTGFTLTTPTPSPTGIRAASFAGAGAGICANHFGLAGADLSVTKSAAPSPVIAGTALTYTIVVTNVGPSAAVNTVLTDAISASLTGVTYRVNGGASNPWTGSVNLGTIPPSGPTSIQTVTITGTVNINTCNPISNVATISSSTSDPDPANNTSATILTTVIDQTLPTITCPANVNATTNTGCTATAVALGTPVTADNCGVASVTNNAPAAFPLGATTVRWTVTDNSGNTATCNQTVTITDNTPPTITCPTNVTASTTSGCTATGVALGTPVTADNCGVATVTNNAPATYVLGANTVTWTVTDNSGNTATCNQVVTITDNEPPTISCPANVNAFTNTACTATGVSLGTPTTSDNCGVASVTNNAPAAFPLGVTIVTWTATDNSGNTETCNQIVIVTDNVNPTITCPANVATVTNTGCTATGVALGTPVTADNCGVSTVTNNAPASFPLGVTTVTWTVADNSGNSATCNQTVTVTDNVNPTITCPANIVTVTNTACTATGVALGTPVTADNCGVASVSNNAPAAFPLGVTTVTWTVTDNNGNTATCNQTVTVTDNVNPTITCPANVATVTNTACTATGVALGTPVTADNCGVASVTNNAPAVFPLGVTTVTWTVTDNSGNTATCNQTVTVTDNVNPTITCPANVVTVTNTACTATGIALGTPVTADNCGVASVLNNAPAAFPLGVTTVTWTVTDNSGNTATCNQTVTVTDNVNPTITCPANVVTVTNTACTATGVALGTPVTADNCGVASVSNNAPAAFPLGVTTVTWTVTDNSGNTATCNQTVTVTDNVNPTITCPANVVTVTNTACTATGVALGTPVTADNCGVASVTNNAPAAFPLGVTTVTWTVTDNSGNTATCNQTVTVTDNVNPTITCPANVVTVTNTACTATGVALGTPVTSDNCGVASVTNNAPAAFPLGVTTVTWTVTDNSGNTATCNQTVTVTDNVNPTITCPANVVTVTNTACTATGVALGTPVTADNCGVASVLNNAPAAFPLGVTTVTWTVTDNSGNTATCNQTVTVTDNVNPTITCPANVVTVTNTACTATGVALGTPVTADNCGVASVLNNAPATFPLGVTTVTWTVTDNSGNTATCNQTVTVTDNVPPSITCPATVNVNTDPGFSYASGVVLGAPITSDNCGVAAVVNNAPAQFAIGATSVTWTVTDVNGLTATCTQTVNVTDNQAPVINCPATITVSCIADVPVEYSTLAEFLAAGGSASDNDGINASSFTLVSENSDGMSCPQVITRIYTVADNSNNFSTCTQLIIIDDNLAPIIAALPATSTIYCPFTPVFAVATATDNCISFTLTYNDVTTPGVCAGSYSVTRTWTATDLCGNTSTASQTINVLDISGPVFDPLPAISTINCPATPVFAVATATDACGSAFTLTSNDITTPGACAGTYSVTRTWTATDACGNTSTASQTINVQDITAPVIDPLPAVSTISCPLTPVFAVATATDNCGSAFTLTYNDITTPGACAGTYSVTRTWTATDACGNSSTASQTINVQDISAPVINALPAVSTINCPATPAFALATATDACGSAFTLTSNDITTPGACAGSYSVTRTWTATDACGNSSTASQTINVQDISAPVINALPAVSTINCPATPVFAVATATDACGSAFTLTSNDITTNGACAGTYSVTRTWTATDACGNSSTASQTINVQDISAPVIDPLPAISTINCPATPVFAVATATDACGSAFTLTSNDITTPGACAGSYSVTRTWTATDACGNSSTASQTINVQDISAPVINALPAVSTINCPATPVFAVATATDNCGSAFTLTSNDVTTTGACAGTYSVTRTWTATDACGNSSTASQTINVQDISAPVIDPLPAVSTINCPATPVFAVATATDACGSAFTLTSQ